MSKAKENVPIDFSNAPEAFKKQFLSLMNMFREESEENNKKMKEDPNLDEQRMQMDNGEDKRESDLTGDENEQPEEKRKRGKLSRRRSRRNDLKPEESPETNEEEENEKLELITPYKNDDLTKKVEILFGDIVFRNWLKEKLKLKNTKSPKWLRYGDYRKKMMDALNSASRGESISVSMGPNTLTRLEQMVQVYNEELDLNRKNKRNRKENYWVDENNPRMLMKDPDFGDSKVKLYSKPIDKRKLDNAVNKESRTLRSRKVHRGINSSSK